MFIRLSLMHCIFTKDLMLRSLSEHSLKFMVRKYHISITIPLCIYGVNFPNSRIGIQLYFHLFPQWDNNNNYMWQSLSCVLLSFGQSGFQRISGDRKSLFLFHVARRLCCRSLLDTLKATERLWKYYGSNHLCGSDLYPTCLSVA